MLLKSKKLSLVAVLALLGATLVAPPAWAATDSCSASGTFTITNNVVTGNTNCAGEAVIPNSVTSIVEGAFEQASKLETVTFAAGSVLESIGDYAFSGTSLTSIIIPNSVTSIGGAAFYNTSLTSIIIPNSVTSIGGAAFYNTSLTSITIPNRVTSIGYQAFFGTTSLTSITIPNSVTSIGDYAFYGTSLTSIDIPNSVNSIGVAAFYYNTSLTSITFEGNAPGAVGSNAFALIGANAVANIGFAATGFGAGTTWNGLIIGRSADRNVDCGTSGTFTITNNVVTGNTNCVGTAVIPTGVTSIGSSAFFGTSLTSITIPNSVTSIRSSAFRGSSLASITIPNSVTSIGDNAFYLASSLETLNFQAGSTLDSIGESAFEGTDFTSVTIPASVTSIEDYAFYNAASLGTLTFEGNAPRVGFRPFGNVSANAVANISFAATNFGAGTTWNGLIIVRSSDRHIDCSTSGTFTITNNVVTGNTNCAGAAVIPSGVTSIGFDAFRAGELTSITIPNSVTSIGGNAFLQARALTSINIGNSVTSIGNAAFYEASSLETVTFAAGSVLDSIGNYAFRGTTSLESVTIPNSVTSIGMQAFAGTTSLTSITFEGNAPGAVGTNVFLLAGTNAVANIGSAATGFGDGTTWNGLTIVRAEDTTLPTVTPVTEETSAGATLVINGTNLDRITKVTIGGTAVPIGERTKTAITVTVPAGLAAGNYTIVLNGDDPSWPSWVTNAKVVAPTAPTATPVTGETNAGATLVIKGTNMDRITKVTIGDTIVPIAARTKTSITVTVPAGLAAGNYTIVLTTVEATALAGGLANVVAGEPEAATNQKVNAGSFNTYVAVYAKGYKGQRLSWKIAGKWFKTILTKDYHVFQRSTIAVGLEVKVDLFIDGERLLAKTVLTR